MSALATYLGYGFYLLLVLSLLTLAAFVAYVVMRFRRSPQTAISKLIATYVSAITSIGTLAVSAIGVLTPISLLPRDEAQAVVEQFYAAVDAKRFDEAWRLIHSARKEELNKDGRFDARRLADLYEDSSHENMQIAQQPSGGLKGRAYRVTFDVENRFRQNSFYALRWAPLEEAFGRGLLDEGRTIALVMEDLGRYFELPEGLRPQLRATIATKNLEFLFAPEFVDEAVSYLRREAGIDLRLRAQQSSMSVTRRHFILNLRLAPDDGRWRIRTGLATPELVAPYRPRL